MFSKINPKQVSKQQSHRAKGTRTVDSLLALLEPSIVQQLNPQQWQDIRRIVQLAIGKNSPKIIDLNFTIDLIISRFYFRLLVGKDVRHEQRKKTSGSRIGNLVAAIGLIVTLNVLVSVSVFVIVYLLKSAIGIDLIPGGHWRDWVIHRI